MIRITGGVRRGRVLPAPVPNGVRPTAGRVREAVFSMVGQDLAGWSMLDLFGGSGLMAIEAASRGAAPVTVVERNTAAVAAIRRNAEGVGVNLTVRPGDAARVALEAADLVYLDPPFRDPIGPWIARAAGLCRRVLVAEARAPLEWPAAPPGFAVRSTRAYGDVGIALYDRIGTHPGLAESDVVAEDRRVIECDG